MSAFFVVIPTLTALAWPVVQLAVTSALTGLGYSVATTMVRGKNQVLNKVSVDLDLKNTSAIAAKLGEDEELVLTKEDITLTFKRTVDGKCMVNVCASGKSEQELKQIGTDVTNRIIQKIVYDKVMSELKHSGFSIIQEKSNDNTIRLKARKW